MNRMYFMASSLGGWSPIGRTGGAGIDTARGLRLAGDLAEQRAGDDQPLDLARALVDLGHLRVAEVALGRELLGVAVAAEHLDRLARPVARDARREQLGLRALDRVRAPRVLEPRGAPRERARRLDLGLHVGELVLDRLEAADRAAERVTLAGVRRREVERRLRDADGLRRDADAPAVERRQRDAHPGARRAEPLGRRVLEEQIGGRARVLAELLLLAGDAEPVRALAHEEAADALAVAREDVERVRVGAVGDPLLGAVQAAVGVARAHRCRVAPRARLGQAERAQLVALRRRRNEALDLLLAPEGQDRQLPRADVDAERRPQPRVAARDLLHGEDVGQVVGARAAVLGGDADAQQPELAHVAQRLDWKAVLAVPGRRLRRHLVVGEAPREVADLALLVGQLVEAHRGSSLRVAVPSTPATVSAATILIRPPSRSKRSTAQPSWRATFISGPSGLTATGWPTARSIGRSDSPSL